MQWTGRNVLITGGTGSLGHALVERILPLRPRRLIVFSRDELKQSEMQKWWPDDNSGPMRYFLGDVRDKERLCRAFVGVDIVIHAAALKQVPALEYNPLEAVRTNVQGAQNVIEAALDCRVSRVVQVSTDKACQPVNTYGKTKALAESLMVRANSYAGSRGTRFAVCRYGNVVGSRGSVVPLFERQRQQGFVTITDTRMTRFWLPMERAVGLINYSLEHMQGGEIFVPRIPSIRITDLASAMAPECEMRLIGIRPGEKLHETLIHVDEARNAAKLGDVYVIQPSAASWNFIPLSGNMPDGWYYSSDTNDQWLTVQQLAQQS